jgi:hypothetical protein
MKVWQVPRIWENGEVWIIGGGPSLLSCFDIPDSEVNLVRERKADIDIYSPYLAPLHSKHVIGINVAYKFGNWIDICFFGDKGFFSNHRGNLSVFRKMVVTCCAKVAEKNLSWVKYLPQEKKKVGKDFVKYGISTNPSNVCWNDNSGAAAISVAAWTGAKRIVLVGFDMNLDPANKEQHFHNLYREKGKGLVPKQLPFNQHLKGWSCIKSDADNMGIEILNTSLNSAIKEIPKVHIKELL